MVAWSQLCSAAVPFRVYIPRPEGFSVCSVGCLKLQPEALNLPLSSYVGVWGCCLLLYRWSSPLPLSVDFVCVCVCVRDSWLQVEFPCGVGTLVHFGDSAVIPSCSKAPYIWIKWCLDPDFILSLTFVL